MQITRGWIAVVAVAVLAVGGCSDEGSAPAGESPPATAGSSEATPSQEPEPTRYTAEQLGAALPRGPEQMHGVTKPAYECRDLTKPCGDIKGWGIVDATSDPDSMRLVVSVKRVASSQAEQQRACRSGPFHTPLRWNPGHTTYRPGERGHARRIAFSIGEWEGFICQKTGVHVFSDGPGKHHSWQVAYLTNGRHELTTAGLTMEMTRKLAEEYLARLTTSSMISGP